VHLAQDARNEVSTPAKGPLLIAGSVGPYGAYLANGSEYTGAYTLSPDEFKAFHRGRITALLDAGADILACETLPSYAETMALAQMLDAEFPTTESFFAFTLSSPAALPDGTPLSTLIPALERYANIVAVGVNCVSPELALEGLKEIAKFTRKPLVVYPNSGERWDAGARQWGGRKSEGGELVRWVEEVWAVGGRVVGGCCRTGPDEIGVIGGVVGGKNGGL
jgi:S-methylmethionine-dependent homocysteine/selenocysteine methylase